LKYNQNTERFTPLRVFYSYNFTIYNEDGSINYTKDDSGFRSLDGDVLAVWEGGRIGFVGTVIKFLQDPLAFGLIILLPLVLLFGYNIFLVVKMIIADKTEKARKAALEEANANKLDEEEIKRRAIEEFLASQKKSEETE
jgi:signal peptidase